MIKILNETKITNHNTADLCMERYCDNKEEYFFELQIDDSIYLLNVCKEHSEQVNKNTDEWEEKYT